MSHARRKHACSNCAPIPEKTDAMPREGPAHATSYVTCRIASQHNHRIQATFAAPLKARIAIGPFGNLCAVSTTSSKESGIGSWRVIAFSNYGGCLDKEAPNHRLCAYIPPHVVWICRPLDSAEV
jgi:hypothetical protein